MSRFIAKLIAACLLSCFVYELVMIYTRDTGRVMKAHTPGEPVRYITPK